MSNNFSVSAKFTADASGFLRASQRMESALSNIERGIKATNSILSDFGKRAGSAFRNAGKYSGNFHDNVNKLSKASADMGHKFVSATQKTSGGFRGATEKAQSFSKQVLASTAGVAVFEGIHKAVDGVSTAVKESIDYYDQMTAFSNGLKVLGVNTNDIKKTQSALNTQLKGTGVEATSATGAISALVSSGMKIGKATDVAIAFSKGMALTGTSAEGAEGFMRQYAQGVAKGKFELEDFNTMNENAPGILDQVAKSLLGAEGNSRKLYEAMKNGKISVAQMNEAVTKLGQNKWDKAIKNQTLTVGQGMTELKKSTLELGRTFIEKINEMVQKSFNVKGIGNLFSNLSGNIDGLTQKLQSLTPEQIVEFCTKAGTAIAGMGASLLAFNSAGYFAKMADGLISAQVKMKQSLSSLITDLDEKTILARVKISELSDSFLKSHPKFNEGVTKFKNSVDSLPPAFTKSLSTAKNTVSTGTSAMVGVFNMGLKAIAPAIVIATLLTGLGSAYSQYQTQIDQFIQTSIQKGPEIIGKLSQGIVEKLPSLINNGVQMLGKIVEGINANMPALLQGATQIITTLVDSLISNMPQLVQQGISLIENLAMGLAQNLPTIVTKGFELITSFITSIADRLPEIVQKGADIIITLAQGMMENFPTIVSKAVEAIGHFVSGIINSLPQILEAGAKIIGSLVDGIISKIPFVNKAWDKIKEKIGIKNKEIEGEEKKHTEKMKSEYDKSASNADKSSKKAKDAQTKNAKDANKNVSDSYYKMDASTKKTMESMTSGVNLNSKEQTENVSKNAYNMSKNVGKAYDQMTKATEKASSKMTSALDKGFSRMSNEVNKFVKNSSAKISAGMRDMTKTINSSMSSSANAVVAGMNKMNNAFSKGIKSASTTVVDNLKRMTSVFKDGMGKMASIASSGSAKIKSTMVNGFKPIPNLIKSIMGNSVNIVRSYYGAMYNAGAYITIGLNNGIVSRSGVVYANVQRMANNIERTMRKAMDIHSPSRVFKSLGGFISEGLAVGIEEKAGKAINATKSLANATTNAFDASFNVNDSYAVNTRPQPAYINLNLGGQNYRAFVEDISNEQGYTGNLSAQLSI